MDLTVGQSGHQLCLSKGSALGHAVIVKDISILDEFSASNQISVVNYDLDTKELPFLEQYKEIKDKLEKYKDAILIAEYPSVGLIPLIPFVKGMVFTRGTVLCHTAIVLREKHIPSTIWPEVFEKVEEGDRLLINDNQVQLLSKSKQSV
ncbi:PEP-utilizing enzyme [Caenibacillus caldisaponilyticus]|uniref:PEP-utilizing enzyme n=1 Tax=Caenibacillus caldisaponilyticus TaxID=1674942 RepID=UPI0011777E9E|nr:PEP-utilizing enzyme [Caenibacillus caldisaponilyticus]